LGDVRGIIAHLPQPGANVSRPEKVLVQAQVRGNMIGKLQAEDSGEAPFMQNGVSVFFFLS
jgi:hypothetical protein